MTSKDDDLVEKMAEAMEDVGELDLTEMARAALAIASSESVKREGEKDGE
jgi:hypothetical protein